VMNPASVEVPAAKNMPPSVRSVPANVDRFFVDQSVVEQSAEGRPNVPSRGSDSRSAGRTPPGGGGPG
jgi:hypothetical protein